MTNFDLEVLVLTSDESQHFNTLNLSEKSLTYLSLFSCSCGHESIVSRDWKKCESNVTVRT